MRVFSTFEINITIVLVEGVSVFNSIGCLSAIYIEACECEALNTVEPRDFLSGCGLVPEEHVPLSKGAVSS